MHKLKKGFTLIELLIVVAIIAILAAIAVPNFLEAQVRAKVSRAQSDMRTLATAVEAYVVDNGRGPICANEASQTSSDPRWAQFPLANYTNQTALMQLTTPISYVATMLKDPFTEKGATKANSSGQVIVLNNPYYTYRSYFNPEVAFWGNAAAVPVVARRGYTWSFQSFGPSRKSSRPNGVGSGTLANMLTPNGQGIGIYDPSNGTVSYGWLARTNKGIVTGSDFDGLY